MEGNRFDMSRMPDNKVELLLEIAKTCELSLRLLKMTIEVGDDWDIDYGYKALGMVTSIRVLLEAEMERREGKE